METPVNAAAGDPTESLRTALVERADALYRDVDFNCIREWKLQNGGAKAVGFLPIYAPREIIHAAGMLPVGVLGGGDAVEIVKGDACFQSYICHLPRSVVELGLNGALDCLDGMIFPSTCDVIRNLSGMWQILFPNCYVKYLDMPQNYQNHIGGEFFERELSLLIDDLEKLGGERATPQRLRHSIALYNENRRLVEELYKLRIHAPWTVPSSELYLIVRAGMLLPVEEHNKLCKQYIDAVRASARRPMDMARVVLRGCFCEQPPLDLIKTLERSGCYIVDDDWMIVSRWIDGDVSTEGDPLANLVQAFLQRSPACPSLYLQKGKKGDALVEATRDARAEGVIFSAPSFCDPALLDQPMTLAAVKNAQIPCTSFLFAENTGQFQTIREQAGTFADAIKLS
ncbi:MAG: benzoyl-CoA reductase subunit C [Planctomycetes bacterium]|nr:benzoyl-CoA reductase subunit C [Planctomycetota bacterium]